MLPVTCISHKFIDSPIKGPQGIYIYNMSIYYNCFITAKKDEKKPKTALMFSPLV
jgi:hypothetical protein